MEEYIVQRGDTLKTIAKERLSDEQRWYEIAQLNGIESPYRLYIGVRIKLPNKLFVNKTLPPHDVKLEPAWIIPARGFTFVIFEQLPEIGSKNVLRKVQVIPTDFSLKPKNPLANYSLAEHAWKGDILDTQLLSASNKPYGSPTGKAGGYKDVLLIDTQRAMAQGSKVYSVPEVVADLRRYAAETGANVDTLIRTIEKVEGEVLIENGVSSDAVKRVSSAHTPYIETADEIWAAHKANKITLEQAENKLAALAKSYERAKIVGRVGRVLTVVGVVFTAVDMGVAGKNSYDRNSFRPLAAETVRQTGAWSGAVTGGVLASALLGAKVGAAFGIGTGPGAIITGAIGAMVFGGIGYWRGDVIAGWIDPPEEVTNELRKDVNFAEGLKNRDIVLTIGATESQYDFRHRALEEAAKQVQREALRMVDNNLPTNFANKFTPPRASNIKDDYQLYWTKDTTGKNPAVDENDDGIINNEIPRGSNAEKTEWQNEQGRKFTYRLGENEVNELIRMVFGLSR